MNIWIKELLKNLDKNLNETKKIEIMEACGEKCPFAHLTDEKLLDIKKKKLKMKMNSYSNYLKNGELKLKMKTFMLSLINATVH